MIAIGLGCRKACAASEIEALVREAMALADQHAATPVIARNDENWKLFTIADKHDEPSLAEAADRLGLELMFLPREALREQAAKIHTASLTAERLFGVPSVAEAAALAGAGPGGTLIVPRIANAVATCAVARAAEPPR